MRCSVLCAFLFLFAACSGDPLADGWSQQLPGGAKGAFLEFDGASDRFQLHTAPRADGGHDHVNGTYMRDGASLTLVVTRGALANEGDGKTWTGTLSGDRLDLRCGEHALEFRRGGKAHGH